MNELIHQAFLILLPVSALVVIFMKNLINAVIIFSVLSLFVIVAVYQLKAPDVALSLLLVNALSVVLFLFTIHKTEVEE
ncbi:MAG: DUF4040 domain-containing protein [Theionarchaea archaeon]|nr:DUF4040 domain-containing protein [Theionarchaea archaeon]